MMFHSLYMLRVISVFVAVVSTAQAECIRQPDGTWRCLPTAPQAQPTAMDIRVECPTSRGSGTSVARSATGGTLIVTNHHVIDAQSSVLLHASSGASAAAVVCAVDRQNDLALLEVQSEWPHVKLGSEVAIGTPVHFRAFDAGVTFRKYYGQVTSRYHGAGAGGFFATGASRSGNSGGGVYSQGRLVGVVWGNPNGGTAFVPIGPVRALLERAQRSRIRKNSDQERKLPIIQPSSSDEGCERACDCDARLERIEAQLTQLANLKPIAPSPPPQIATPAVGWLHLAAAALGVSTPLGVAILAAGFLVRVRRPRRRGLGGPRTESFPQDHRAHE